MSGNQEGQVEEAVLAVLAVLAFGSALVVLLQQKLQVQKGGLPTSWCRSEFRLVLYNTWVDVIVL